jgi:hypothetical protein
VSISNDPQVVAGDISRIKAKDLKDVFAFVKKNKQALLNHWSMKTTSDEMIMALKK